MAAEVEVLLSDSDLEDEDESQWFDNTLQLAGKTPESCVMTPASDSDELSDRDDTDDDDSLFFSDEDVDDPELYMTRTITEVPGVNKIAQLGADVAHTKQQLNIVHAKVEEGERMVENARDEVTECRERQKELSRELQVTGEEIRAAAGNIPSVQRLTNLQKRLEDEVTAEKELEEELKVFVRTQELSLNEAKHVRGQYQHLEVSLTDKEKTLNDIKSSLVLERKRRERQIVLNAEKKAINVELKESLVNLEHEERTRQAIDNAKEAQRAGQKFLKETWKRVKDREMEEEEQKRVEGERRVKMLLQYKQNLHKTQSKLKKASQKKKRLLKEKATQDQGISAEERYQTSQQTIENEKKAHFTSTQRQAKSALVSKILKEEKALEKRKEQHPQLFNDRLKGRHNKPTRQKYKHILDLAKPKSPQKLEPLLEKDRLIQRTVGYSSSEDEEEEMKEKVVSVRQSEVDDELAEPEFRGLWEAAPPKKLTPPSKFSKLEQAKMEEVLQKQRDNIVQKQITVQREFKGQAFMSKPEEVIFSDYEVGETYTQHLTLTNVSYTINTLKLIAMSTNLLDFIAVEFSPPGHLSAGLTCEMRVTFTPLINKDITGEIKMLAQTGAFSIPVKCRVKRTEISVPNSTMDFGTVCIGEHKKCFITIVNKGALGTRFKVLPAGWVNPPRTAQTERQFTAEGGKRPIIGGLEDKPDESSSNIQGPPSKMTSSVTFSLRGDGTTIPATPDTAAPVSPELNLETESPVPKTPVTKPKVEEAAAPVPEIEEADITLNKEFTSGMIEPHSTVQIEVLYNPRVVGQHTNCFVVTVQDNSIAPVTVTVSANTIDLPIYVQEQSMYLKHCMVDRLYQDSVVLHNRATSALRIKFELPRALKDHVDILPQNGVVQANSSFSAQLKFIPLPSIFENCKKYIGEGQLLTIPVNIRVADQTRSVPFTITAHITGTDISFSVPELDFGCCSIYESVRVEFSMQNHCLLPQMYGFVSLPDFVTIQPNDGFGTLLPGETLHLEAVVLAKVLGDHNFNIICTTEIDRHFSLKCRATGVIPHLEVSQSLIKFAPTALGDMRQASFYIKSESKGEPLPRSFHIVVPDNVDLMVSPSVGTLLPGQRVRVQVTFSPTLKKEEIDAEAFNSAKKKIEMELERKKRDEDAGPADAALAANKKAKSRKGQSKPLTPKSPLTLPDQDAGDLVTVTEENKIAAMVRLKTHFERRFDKVLLPCFTAVGACSPDSALNYNLHDTVYLQVHMPAVRPELLLLSQNGSSVVDFGNVCIGQCEKLELTLKSITDVPLKLTCSEFPHDGTFQKVNATRDLEPFGLHQMLLEFNPKSTAKYYEVVEVRTGRSTLHLHLHGRGVEPKLGVQPSEGALDLGHVMVGEILNGSFTLTNESEIGLQYKISLLSEKSSVVQDIAGTNEIGNSNKSGILPFSCLPHTGSIEKGCSQEITVKFKPDHQDCYKDVVIVTLLNQHQESRVPLLAQAWSGSMFVTGGHSKSTLVNLHTIIPVNPEAAAVETTEDEITGQIWLIFICSMSSPKQTFTETLGIGNIRGLGMKPEAIAANAKDKAKPTGDFVIDPVKADYGVLVKALVATPPKGAVEVGNPLEISFQFTPPKELCDIGSNIEFHTMLSLKGETTESFRINFVAKIVA